MSPGEVISKGAYASRIGKRPSAVSNYIARGKLSGAALTADGRIAVAEADRQLALTLDPGRGRPIQVIDTTSAGALVREESPAARRARAVAEMAELDLEQRRRRLAEAAGYYVAAEQVRANRGRALAQLLAAVDNWLPEVAAELALSRDELAAMRASWRRFRARQADHAATRAMALPVLRSEAPPAAAPLFRQGQALEYAV